MADRAVGIIIRDRQVLLIHRIVAGREYFVLPGGTVEEGEQPQQTLEREIHEETGLTFTETTKIEEMEVDDRLGHYYLIQNAAGEPELGGPEKGAHHQGNQYILEWHPIEEIGYLNVYPEGLTAICEAAMTRLDDLNQDN